MSIKKRNFNSRPREGANSLTGGVPGLLANFNSRPREGANGGDGKGGVIYVYFNSRPREGANVPPAQRHAR